MTAPIPAAIQAFPLVSNLVSLAPGAAKCLGVLGNQVTPTQYFDCNVEPMQIKFLGGVFGAIERRIIFSEDNINWTGGISPTATTDQSGLVGLARFVDTTNISSATAATYLLDEFSVMAAYGGASMPMFWSVLMWNRGNIAFSSNLSDFVADYTMISYA